MIDMEKALRVTGGAISSLSIRVRALCYSFGGESFVSLWQAGDLLVVTTSVPDLVTCGATGFGRIAPSVTPLVRGFGIILG